MPQSLDKMWCFGLNHSDLWIENNFWEIWQIFTKLLILKLCFYLSVFIAKCVRHQKGTKNNSTSTHVPAGQLQKEHISDPGWRGSWYIPPSSYSHILLPWKWPLLSAGCISSPGFLYNFNTYASISHNLGFSFACLKFILLLVSYYMYYLVTFLFFFFVQ